MADALDTIARGDFASRLLGPLTKEVTHRETVILSRIVGAYRSHTLTGEYALLAVAEIASLRSLLSDLESKAADGQFAQQSLL